MNHTILSVASLTLALATTSPMAVAQIVTVGPSGSGAQFDSVHTAVASASPGAVLQIAPGIYRESGVLVLDKPLTLLGAGSDRTHLETTITQQFEHYAVRVEGLPAGASVRVVGMSIVGTWFGGATSALEVVDCAGSVELGDLDATVPAGLGANAYAPTVSVRNAAMVQVARCRFQSGTRPSGNNWPALHVEHSLVHLDACELVGASTVGALSIPILREAAAGILVQGGTLRMNGCDVRGGAGVAHLTLFGLLLLPGAEAVRVAAGTVHVRGGERCELRGGHGGFIPNYLNGSSAGGAALRVEAGALASMTPDVVRLAGADGDGVVRTAAVLADGAFAALPHRLPTNTPSPLTVSPGAVAAFDLHGEPGAVCLPLLDLVQRAPFGLPGVLGEFTLAFAPALTLPLATLDVHGSGSTSFPLAAAAPIGVAAYVQTLSFGPSGSISVAPPAFFVVR